MIVYVVLEGFYYEGQDIKAIFSTKEKAELYVASREDLWQGQTRDIEEWTIDCEGGE